MLTSKVALVTGGTRGIGAGIARVMARQGARVALLDLDGAEEEKTAACLSAPGMALACDVAVEAEVAAAVRLVVVRGDLYVADGYGNSRVHKFAPDGTLLLSWGEPGTDPGQFNIPHNICCDPDGWVYVADRENHRVQVFDGNGKYEAQWTNMHRPSDLYMERGPHPRFYVGEIGGGVAVNYDVPAIGPRVSIYSPKGEMLARLGQRPAGLEPGQFISPHGLAVDSRGDIYVGEVSFTNWGNRYKGQPHPPGLRSLQKLVKVR